MDTYSLHEMLGTGTISPLGVTYPWLDEAFKKLPPTPETSTGFSYANAAEKAGALSMMKAYQLRSDYPCHRILRNVPKLG